MTIHRPNPTAGTFVAVALAVLAAAPRARGGCTDGGNGGCSPPVGAKWDRWDMAGSTYTYCYQGCAVDYFFNNSGTYNYSGVVGVDHYWTHQVWVRPRHAPTHRRTRASVSLGRVLGGWVDGWLGRCVGWLSLAGAVSRGGTAGYAVRRR